MWSCGLLVCTKVSAAAFTRARFDLMLALLSITRPTAIGISALLNAEIVCGAPFSSTRKFCSFNSGTKFPFLSTTVTGRRTMSTVFFSVYGPFCGIAPGGGGSWFCADVLMVPNKNTEARQKLRNARMEGNAMRLRPRGVVSIARVYGERRQSSRRTQLDLDFAPFSVVFCVARPVTQNILISQLHADLRSDVPEVVQVPHHERSPAGHRRQLLQQARSVAFLHGSVASVRGNNSNSVNLDVRLA